MGVSLGSALQRLMQPEVSPPNLLSRHVLQEEPLKLAIHLWSSHHPKISTFQAKAFLISFLLGCTGSRR